MAIVLYLAGFLAIIVGVAHSVLGERYILTRLFRRGDLPKLFGGTEFTERTLRFAWHVTSIAWWGFAAVLFQLAVGPVSNRNIATVVGVTFCTTAFVVLVASRGRHLAWPVFLFIGCAAFYAAVA
jgi:hypothetical protein